MRHRRLIGGLSALLASVMLCPATAVAELQCKVAADDLNFGLYQPMSATPVDSVGNVRVSCQGGRGAFAVRLGAGRGGQPTNRFMTSAGGLLYYNMYTNASRTVAWGDGSGATGLATGAQTHPRRTIHDFPVYGRIFPSQDAVPGIYDDDIVVTVTF